jgi:hypothetical protein
MADLTQKERSSTTRIVGSDEVYSADVIFEDGIKKLATTKKVSVESLAGVTIQAFNAVGWGDVATGDTVSIIIPATDSSPAFTKNATVQAGEDRYDFAARIVLELNQDFTNFQPYHRATQVKNNSIITIEAKTIAEAGENKTVGSFDITGTGTIASSLYKQYDNYEARRSTTVQASFNTDDPRVGVFGVEGRVTAVSGDVTGIVPIQPYANGDTGQIDLNINGSVTPVEFTFPMDALNDYYVSEIRLFGLDSNISFGKFLGRNSEIPNALMIDIKSDNNISSFPAIESTDDFADKFAGSDLDLFIQSGSDKFIASLKTSPFPLRRAGTFGVGNDDYFKVTVGANLSQVTKLQCLLIVNLREA